MARIYTSITLAWDEQLRQYVTVADTSHEYTGPVARCCGASQAQQNVANQQAAAFQTMQQQAQQEFGNSSTVFKDLMSTLSPTVAAGPDQEGFSPAEKSALQSQAITQTGQAYKNAKYAAGEAQAAQGGGNLGDVTSGSKTATDLNLASSAANQTSSELNQIDQADYATGRQNYNDAVTQISNAPSVFNVSNQGSGVSTTAGQAAEKAQDDITSQNDSWVQAVTGALGNVAGVAAGTYIGKLGK